MAASGYTPIQLYRTATSGLAPDAGSLTNGELAINYYTGDMAIYAKNSAGVVKRLMNNPASLKYPTADGTANQVIQTDGSGNLSFASLSSIGVSSFSAGTTGLTPSTSTTGAITLAGTLAVANGGTGATTAGTARSNLSAASSGANSDITSLTGLTTALSVAQGGTGTATPNLVAGTNITLSGTWPNQTINATATGSGTVNSGTSGQITYYASTGTAVSGLTTGTGVTAALGVNTGSAGAFVVNGGALGTPSSGTLTSATGLPVSTGISGLGTGVATALAVTVNTTSGGFSTIDGTATLTNKRINPRIISITGAAGGTITPTGDTADQYEVTALGAAATFAAPSGTPVDGQILVIRIKDNGTARGLTWTTSSGGYRVVGTTLPTTTAISKTIYVGCIYNTADTFWDVVGVASQA